MLRVGLCKWKTTNVHPILTIMFKSVLDVLIKKKSIHLRHMSISKVFSFRKWSFLLTPSDKATKDITHDLI